MSERIIFNSIINYIYTAGGQKLRKIAPEGSTTNYVGSIVYEGSAIKYILTGKGTYQYGETVSQNEYQYHLKDHLGNTRVVVSQNGKEIQQSAYYPFGLAFMQTINSDNKYLYNGKELQDNKLNGVKLDWYDYGARMYDPSLGRWHCIDPHAENYYDCTLYNYVLNNPIRAIDPNGEDVYILYYTIGNDEGDEAFKASAETRKKEIESSKTFDSEKDKVIMFGVQDISDVQSLTEFAINTYSEKYGETKEVGIWSHGGWDGPIGSVPAKNDPLSLNSDQMSREGWSKINFNWKENGSKISFFGCNTGNDLNMREDGWKGSFARDISGMKNFKNVNIWGQSSSAVFSTDPSYRVTTLARSLTEKAYNFGSTYMVGGTEGQGRKSLWFNVFSKPVTSNPMNVYKNAKLKKSAFQGF